MFKRVDILIQTSFNGRHKLSNSPLNAQLTFYKETQLDYIWVNYNQKRRKGLQ